MKKKPERLNKPQLEPLPEGQCSCNLLSDLFEHMGFHPGASTFMSHPGSKHIKASFLNITYPSAKMSSKL